MGRGNAHSRKWLVTIHLYIGLVFGLVLSIAGLTGSLIVFWQPIDAALNPEVLAPDLACPESAFRPIDDLVDAVQAKIPAGGRLTSLDFLDHERPLLWAWYQMPAPQAEWGDIYTLFVKPCSGDVTGPRLWNSQQRPWGGPLMSALIQLHTSLWLNQWSVLAGNHLLSFGSVLAMGSILVGYYLWWPSRGNWRSAFTLKRGARGIRLHYDLHKVIGACAGGLLLVSLFTAISLYEPWTQVIVSGVNLLSPVTAVEATSPVSTPREGQETISVGRVIAITKAALPSGRPMTLEFPVDEQGTYMVTVDTGAVWNSQVSVDQYSGAVVRIQGPQAASAGDHVLAWLFPLHTGKAFGLPGRIVLVILGVIPMSLYVTGLFLWWRKRRISRVEDRL